MGDKQEELAQKLVAEYGAIKQKTKDDNKLLMVVYESGVKVLIKETLSRMERHPGIDVKIAVTAAGTKFALVGKETIPFDQWKAKQQNGAAESAPKTQPAKKPAQDSSSSSSSSASSSSSSSASSSSESSEAPKKKASKKKPASKPAKTKRGVIDDSDSEDMIPAKKRAKPAAKAKPAKKATPKASPRRGRKVVASDDESEDKPKKPIDINDDDEATLAMVALHISQDLDLSDAAALEAQRLAKEEEESRKKPPRPTVQKWPANLESLAKKVQTIEGQLNKAEAKARIKDDTKEVSLTTSKNNYIDPRVICAWAQRENVRVNQVYSATQIQKFPWAINIDPDYRF
eukprot:TRINITY_DN2958_c0_g2_i12.p1 TRINITY_DN2958_c0_g2~~TRINITY_DN2958_c0_g2_i12.p1  ORF type:complete len:345 (+),score=126.20 TRINITY_DN2958_c0_g2_i12:46-1080(+)